MSSLGPAACSGGNVCDDIEYNILDDFTRNVKYNNDSALRYCDKTGHHQGNYGQDDPQWLGRGWYRMMHPAGTKIPESTPGIARI